MTEKQPNKVFPKIAPPTDDYYMGMLLMEAAMCQDPDVQHGAMIVNTLNVGVLASGFNYMPRDYQTRNINWGFEDKKLSLVYAEEDVIDKCLVKLGQSSKTAFMNCTMYVTGPPALRAVRNCLRVGLKNVTYHCQKPHYFDEVDWNLSKQLAKAYKMNLKPFEGNLHWLLDRIERIKPLF
jgi:deoxycytidylate deaminase